uniref:Uncharacterized protein n=1 Tax=Lepeophtheirus salmonis TaxID=72036 RepID=A0A0K2UUS1_LEPSM
MGIDYPLVLRKLDICPPIYTILGTLLRIVAIILTNLCGKDTSNNSRRMNRRETVSKAFSKSIRQTRKLSPAILISLIISWTVNVMPSENLFFLKPFRSCGVICGRIFISLLFNIPVKIL